MSNSVPGRVPLDERLLQHFGIPAELHDLLEFIGAEFAHKDAYMPVAMETLTFTGSYAHWLERNRLDHWRLVLPCKIPGQRVEIPLPEKIDATDPEGHWRAIITAAADYQALVNTGEYKG